MGLIATNELMCWNMMAYVEEILGGQQINITSMTS